MDAMEKNLYQSKWWDYRLMMPRTATLACTLAYLQWYANHKKMMGERAYEVQLIANRINPSEPEKWQDWNAMTNVRQFCDLNGYKYWEFWYLAFKAHTELKMPTRLTKRQTIIVPFNAFLNVGLRHWVRDRWKDEFGQHMRFAESKFLTPPHYRGHPLQDAYYASLLVALRKNPKNCTPRKIRELIDDGFLSEPYLNRRINGHVSGAA